MNWYKKAFEIENLTDRNMINEKIRAMEEMMGQLERISKIVFQSSKFAKNINLNIMNDKKISSFPTIREILIEADRVCIDNPWKFEQLCKAAGMEMAKKIKGLIRSRDDYSRKLQQRTEKGWYGSDE